MNGISMLIISVGSIIAVLFFVAYAAQKHDLNGIKDKTVGNGQHGTARWATRQEVKQTYHHVPYTPNQWRQAAKEGKQPTSNGKPLPQGIVLGCQGGRKTTALVDSDDVHVLMIGASGVGKTAYFLYPNLEYACASGMSFLALDTKGDLARNYGAIAHDIYGYRISVVDLREPTRSDGNNLLTLINRYMDDHREDPTEITAKAKAEKYAKILAKTIISPEGEGSDHGQNAYFYDAAEGLLASVVLLLSEFLPPEETDGYETRHIASVFKLVQELLMQGRRGGNQFHLAREKVENLILGCTHYPIVEENFHECYPQLHLINPALEQANAVKAYLAEQNALNPQKKGTFTICTSGDPQVYVNVGKRLGLFEASELKVVHI